jgi:hypothetical protein
LCKFLNPVGRQFRLLKLVGGKVQYQRWREMELFSQS